MEERLIKAYGQANLHEALLAVLYADLIAHDSQKPKAAQDAFKNYVRHYIDNLVFHPADENAEAIRQETRERSRKFFEVVESVLRSEYQIQTESDSLDPA
ncbi:MAG: hypothetical protein ACJ74W_18740 [Pyrinomonadaceae bacterium]